jgi:hypothetical protein
MRMIVKPTQIQSNYNDAYLNTRDVGEGGIGVWLWLNPQPTYLLGNGPETCFVTFASQAWADEWFQEHGAKYEVLWKFEPEESEVGWSLA